MGIKNLMTNLKEANIEIKKMNKFELKNLDFIIDLNNLIHTYFKFGGNFWKDKLKTFVKNLIFHNKKVFIVIEGDEIFDERKHHKNTKAIKNEYEFYKKDLLNLYLNSLNIENNEEKMNFLNNGLNELNEVRKTFTKDIYNAKEDFTIEKLLIEYGNKEISELQSKLQKLNKNLRRPTKNDIEELIYYFKNTIKNEIRQDHLPKYFFCKSTNEADFYIAHLCNIYNNAYVISGDSDLLVRGAKKLVFNVNVNTSELEYYDINRILNGLNITFNQFINLCVLMGDDYFPKTILKKNGDEYTFNELLEMVREHETSNDLLINLVNSLFYVNNVNENEKHWIYTAPTFNFERSKELLLLRINTLV